MDRGDTLNESRQNTLQQKPEKSYISCISLWWSKYIHNNYNIEKIGGKVPEESGDRVWLGIGGDSITVNGGKIVLKRHKRSASGMDHNINMDNVGLESLVRLLMEARLLSVWGSGPLLTLTSAWDVFRLHREPVPQRLTRQLQAGFETAPVPGGGQGWN